MGITHSRNILLSKAMKQIFKVANLFLIGVVFLLSVGSKNTYAAPITLTWVDSGTYDATGGHDDSSNTTYIAGTQGSAWRNFFVFDLSSVQAPISSATLRLFNPGGFFDASSPTALYTIYDVLTPIATLRAGGQSLTSIWTDLGEGVVYGSRIFSAQDAGTIVDIQLNGNAITALNGSIGLFAFGGRLTNSTGLWNTIFGSTNFSHLTRQLIVETQPIPEPSTLLLFGTGLAALAGWRHRKSVNA